MLSNLGLTVTMQGENHSSPEPVAPESTITRVIWILWLQGFENAPEIVRMCVRSWQHHNPTWRVITLDRDNLSDHVDAESLSTLMSLKVPLQKTANLLRLYLISTHGGVWADATCFCCLPLDDWLVARMRSGFFALRFRTYKWYENYLTAMERAEEQRVPLARIWKKAATHVHGFTSFSGDKVLANWFLASVKGNLLASTFYSQHLAFFLTNTFPLQGTEKGEKRIAALKRVLNHNARLAQLWTHPVVVRSTQAFPYFVFHYHFARLIRENRACRDVWDRTPVLFAEERLKLKDRMNSPMWEEQIQKIQRGEDPVYKLSWRLAREPVPEGSVLDFLSKSLQA